MPETAFLGAQIALKLLSAGASPQTPLGELTALPQTPSWIQGALLLRLLLLRGGEGTGREGNEGKGGREGEGEGRGEDHEKLCIPKNSLE